MNTRFPDLIKKYDHYRDESRKLPKEEILKKAKYLLLDIQKAGMFILDPDERDHLREIARKLGMEIYDISENFPDVSLELPIQKMEIVNRTQEIQTLTHIYSPPYVLLLAPQGYGKTRLLETIKILVEKHNWLCIYAQLEQEKAPLLEDIANAVLKQLGNSNVRESDIEKLGYEVGNIIRRKLSSTQKNVMIMIDGVEKLSEKSASGLLNQFIPAVKEALTLSDKSAQFRVILAGRYEAHWNQMKFTIPLERISLAPLDFSAVYQMVENFAVKKDPDFPLEYKQNFAAHITYFTGGHPACVEQILLKDFGYPIEKALIPNESRYYAERVEPIIHEIDDYITKLEEKHSVKGLKDILNALSVVRIFTPDFLKRLMDRHLIAWDESEYKLENLLLQTYLVSRKRGFLRDESSRYLLAIRQRKTAESDSIEVSKNFVEFYKEKLQQPTSYRPDILIVELLHQQLQILVWESKGTPEQFFEQVKATFEKLQSKQNANVIAESVKELLTNDEEFRFMFNYLFRDPNYIEEPFNELMKQIVKN